MSPCYCFGVSKVQQVPRNELESALPALKPKPCPSCATERSSFCQARKGRRLLFLSRGLFRVIWGMYKWGR